jgi:toxic protein SymE
MTSFEQIFVIMSKFRKLKVYSKYQIRRFGGVDIPEIRLEGKWLEKLGFKQGQMVKVKEQNNRLIITIHNE